MDTVAIVVQSTTVDDTPKIAHDGLSYRQLNQLGRRHAVFMMKEKPLDSDLVQGRDGI